jgi:hypothetical protein
LEKVAGELQRLDASESEIRFEVDDKFNVRVYTDRVEDLEIACRLCSKRETCDGSVVLNPCFIPCG